MLLTAVSLSLALLLTQQAPTDPSTATGTEGSTAEPSAPPEQPPPQPQQPTSTGIPLIDRLLQKLPQEPPPSGPPLQPGQPRPLLGVQFELEDFLNAGYFRDETLRSFVRHPVGVTVDPAILDDDARYIAQQYRDRGFLKARVRWSLDQTPSGDIAVFSIYAGTRAQLRTIEVVGNRGVTDEQLLTGLFHRPTALFALTDRGGVYHAGYLPQDMQTIAKNYADHGYLGAQVKGARAYSNPEGNGIVLRFDAEDGPLYHVGTLVLVGDLPLPPEGSMRVLGVGPGSPAEMARVNAGVERLLDLWRNEGHAAARAVQSQRLHEKDARVDLLIRLEKGPVARVGEVRISGNTFTANHVVRRDLAVREGAIYSLRGLRKSEERLLYTGLFQKVTLKPVLTADPAVVDIEVELVEQQSWYFSIAPSWFPGEGLIGVGLLGFSNFLGQGWRVNAQGLVSLRRQTGRVDFEDPRLLDTLLSFGGNVHRDRYVYPSYALTRTGAAVALGYPLIERLRLSSGYGMERVDMEAIGPVAPYAGAPGFPSGQRRGVVHFEAVFDQRDNILFPSRGFYVASRMDYGGPLALGEYSFVTLSGNFRFYIPLPFGFVVKDNVAGAFTVNPGGGPVPVTERFYEGGPIQTVRGYNFQSISPYTELGDPYDPAGPKISAPLGGVSRFVNNLEVETPPIPVMPIVPVKLFAFMDAGNTWSEKERPFFFPNMVLPKREGVDLPLGLFYSVGVGMMVVSPLFPLRFEFSVPLTRRPQDEPLNFFLSAGSPF
ncbi:MAG: outer membrane protein assembly factor BamA [Myxococcota bacterium]